MRNPVVAYYTSVVIPAKAGTQCHNWIPAFAGMTTGGNVTMNLFRYQALKRSVPVFQEGSAGGRDAHQGDPVQSRMLDEAAIDCVLPHRQAWARGPPRLHHFVVGPRVACKPGEHIAQQGIDCFGHSDLSSG